MVVWKETQRGKGTKADPIFHFDYDQDDNFDDVDEGDYEEAGDALCNYMEEVEAVGVDGGFSLLDAVVVRGATTRGKNKKDNNNKQKQQQSNNNDDEQRSHVCYLERKEQIAYATAILSDRISQINFNSEVIKPVAMRYEKLPAKIDNPNFVTPVVTAGTAPNNNNNNNSLKSQALPRRFNYSSITYNDIIYFFGGNDGERNHSDLFSFNMKTMTWCTNYRIVVPAGSPAPIFAPGHRMAELLDQVVVVGVLDDPKHSTYLSMMMLSFDPHSSIVKCTIKNLNGIPARYFFSLAAKDITTLCLFGGLLKSGRVTNDTFLIEQGQNAQITAWKLPVLSAPAARKNHIMLVLDRTMYIFGGNDGSRDLNDVHYFVGGSWNEVSTLGAMPPPLSSASATTVGNYIYIHGGLSRNQVQSLFYIFDTVEERWTVVQPHNPELFSPRACHHCHIVGPNLLFYGGFARHGKVCNDIVLLKNFAELSVQDNSRVTHYEWLISSGYLSDVAFVCYKRSLDDDDGNNRNKKQGRGEEVSSEPLIINAHRTILCARCPYFASVFAAQHSSMSGDNKEQRSTTLDVTEFEAETFQAFLRFLYTGNLSLKSAEQIREMSRIALYYSHEQVIKLLRGTFNLGDCYKVWHSMTEHIGSLINNKQFHDIVLHTHDGGRILANKSILSRAPYFKNMFLSGMKESFELDIEVENISHAALTSIIKYLYTDALDIPVNVTVEVYINSLIFNIEALIQHAKQQIVKHLEAESVCELFDIGRSYGDSQLVSHCVEFARRNLDKLVMSAPDSDRGEHHQIIERVLKWEESATARKARQAANRKR